MLYYVGLTRKAHEACFTLSASFLQCGADAERASACFAAENSNDHSSLIVALSEPFAPLREITSPEYARVAVEIQEHDKSMDDKKIRGHPPPSAKKRAKRRDPRCEPNLKRSNTGPDSHLFQSY